MATSTNTTSQTQQGVPSINYPIVDSNGNPTLAFYKFMISLWTRTGGASPTGNVQSITVQGSDGILASVENENSNPIISLSLGAITPASVNTTGAIIGGAVAANGTISGTNAQFGTYTPTTFTQTGYVAITDAGGTTRRLMVG